jgi:hypothetical protein
VAELGFAETFGWYRFFGIPTVEIKGPTRPKSAGSGGLAIVILAVRRPGAQVFRERVRTARWLRPG